MTTTKENGHWALVGTRNVITFENFENDIVNNLYKSWLDSVVELTKHQSSTPWFELRTGNLTGTTSKNVLRCAKFILLDNPVSSSDAYSFYNVIGVPLVRPSEVVVAKKLKKDKKNYASLGYTDVIRDDELDSIIMNQKPHDKLVFQKIVRSWCMAPIKTKGHNFIDSFAQGKMAEPKINKAISYFFEARLKNIKYVHNWQTGLVRTKNEMILLIYKWFRKKTKGRLHVMQSTFM